MALKKAEIKMDDKSNVRGIYKITNLVNNKCYIGKSENLATRMTNHIRSLNNGTNKNIHLQSAFNLYGCDSFTIEVVEILNENDDINERERYWIEYYKSYEREYGYNLTKGGDGGNSYVDCMTEEEREEHYRKHIEIRTGENHVNYGKHLYHNGLISKYINDDEVLQYEEQGWEKGSTDLFKQNCSKRSSGVNNPFYGKKHKKESIEKALKTKKEHYIKRFRYYKGTQTKMITEEEIPQYEEDGWIKGLNPLSIEKMKETKRNNPKSHKWTEGVYVSCSRCFLYNNQKIYGVPKLIAYLRQNGYPEIGKKSIEKLIKGGEPRGYADLVGKIIQIKEEK